MIFSCSCESWWAEKKKKKRFFKAFREQELTKRWKGELKKAETAWDVKLYDPKQARTIIMSHPCAMTSWGQGLILSLTPGLAQDSHFPRFPHRAPLHCAPALVSSPQSDPPAPAKHRRCSERFNCLSESGLWHNWAHFSQWYFYRTKILKKGEESRERLKEDKKNHNHPTLRKFSSSENI